MKSDVEYKNEFDEQKKVVSHDGRNLGVSYDNEPNLINRISTENNVVFDVSRVVDSIIENNIDKNGVCNVYFNGTEEDAIKDFLGNYSEYYNIDILKKGIEIKVIADRFKKYNSFFNRINYKNEKTCVDDLCKMAINVYHTLPVYLLNGKMADVFSEKGKLFNKLEIFNGLKMYQEAYNVFIKYYMQLPLSEREKLSQVALDNYNNVFSKSNQEIRGIISPEQLKNSVNEVVCSKMLGNFFEYRNDDVRIVNKISKATQYMSVQEMVDLYKNMKKKEEQTHTRVGITEEVRAQQILQNQIVLQSNFAEAIFYKLNSKHGYSDDSKMTKIELGEICEKYFGESYRFEGRVAVNRDGVVEQVNINKGTEKDNVGKVDEPVNIKDNEVKETKVSSDLVDDKDNNKEVINQARARYFNMPKVEQTFARITGEWSRFEQLINAETLSTEDVQEIASMFRRSGR